MKNLFRLGIFIFISELVGIISTPFTVAAIPGWYATLQKPAFSPPNWIFGPVWTLLYALMGIAAFLVWEKGIRKKQVKFALKIFSAQLFFNFLWSILFFGMHAPVLGLIDIIVLLATIVWTMLVFQKVSKKAFYLLIPYLLWVSFATLLNASIVLLNR